MWGRVRPPFGQLTALERVRLRRVAMRYARHGWDVTPGACLARHRFVCGRAGCPTTGCHPAMEDWERGASADPARVATWWRTRPYSVLLATGRAFDVLEVPAYLGRAALGSTRPRNGWPADGLIRHDRPRDDWSPEDWRRDAWLRRWGGPAITPHRLRGPVAVTPGGRWMFLVRPGEPLRPELEQCLYVVCHGTGSWIPAPPTRLPEGPIRWVVSPEENRWRLPESYPVQQVLIDALYGLAPALPAPLVAAHLPAPRRGGC
jgi:hypothetical protein